MGENAFDLANVWSMDVASLARAAKIIDAELVRRDMADDNLFGRGTD